MLYLAFIATHDVAFDPAVHAREDLVCLSGRVEDRRQGDVIVPSFSVTLPNEGLFLTRTERYAILSEKGPGDVAAVELARGRVLGMPADIGGRTVELEFVSLPPNEDAVLKAAADALRVGEVAYDPDADPSAREAAELYDPVFFPQADTNPASVLAARTQVWRWNRKTLVPELVSTVYDADAPLHDVAGDGIEGSLKVASLDPPRATTKLRLVAHWTQEAKGKQTFPCSPSAGIPTYSWNDLISSMPKPGTPVGVDTGWHVAEAEIQNVDFSAILDSFNASIATHANGDPNVSACEVVLQPATVNVYVKLGYEYRQQREEIVDLSMPASIQQVLGDDRKESIEQVQLSALNIDQATAEWAYENPDTLVRNHYAVGSLVQASGRVWECLFEHDATTVFLVQQSGITLWQQAAKQSAMPDSRHASYFGSDRGVRTLRHALRRLRKSVLQRAHCLEASFDVAWGIGRAMSLGDRCRIVNRRIPNGQCTGVITGLQLTADGKRRTATVTMLVPVGEVLTPPVPGDGQSQTADVVYGVTGPAASQPVNAFALASYPADVEVLNSYDVQKAAGLASGDPVEAISAKPTQLKISVDRLRQEDLLTRRLSVTCEPLPVPHGISLST